MTDVEKLKIILAATNYGDDLPDHQKFVIESAFLDTLGHKTGVRMVFEDMYQQYKAKSKAVNGGDKINEQHADQS